MLNRIILMEDSRATRSCGKRSRVRRSAPFLLLLTAIIRRTAKKRKRTLSTSLHGVLPPNL